MRVDGWLCVVTEVLARCRHFCCEGGCCCVCVCVQGTCTKLVAQQHLSPEQEEELSVLSCRYGELTGRLEGTQAGRQAGRQAAATAEQGCAGLQLLPSAHHSQQQSIWVPPQHPTVQQTFAARQPGLQCQRGQCRQRPWGGGVVALLVMAAAGSSAGWACTPTRLSTSLQFSCSRFDGGEQAASTCVLARLCSGCCCYRFSCAAVPAATCRMCVLPRSRIDTLTLHCRWPCIV
jgi:hypothetical protein